MTFIRGDLQYKFYESNKKEDNYRNVTKLLRNYLDACQPYMIEFFEEQISSLLKAHMIFLASLSEEELKEALDEFRDPKSD